MNELIHEIKKIPGPILILGASGFVGANLFHTLLKHRSDVYGVTTQIPVWRLASVPASHIIEADLTAKKNCAYLLDKIQPITIFDCIAYGGYSFEKNLELIYQTNLMIKVFLIDELMKRNIHCYIHAGSSSEYGDNSTGPKENAMLAPTSHYAVAKVGTASLLYHVGKHHELPCANLRLYSVYGPLEDSSRLVPTFLRNCLEGKLPPFVKPDTSRDFIYVDDVCEAFIITANRLTHPYFGESFNIGTGIKTTIREFASLGKELFNVCEEPQFLTMPSRSWDIEDWYANPNKAFEILGFKSRVSLSQGLIKTVEWLKTILDKDNYIKLSKQHWLDNKYSVTAIIACYKDAQAIPIMAERLISIFKKCQIDYEIIFVNDGSPDDSEEIIQSLSVANSRILGITHTRNFGSQAAFRSGMEIATKNACILLDGDLQDPPELIEQFLAKWREGFDVIYGVRVKREVSLFMQISYKLFYRLFNWFSEVPIPHDAGDFSLIDKRVVSWLLACNERDLFLRGLRAYVGFKQTGVPYTRPERMFGKTTNNLIKNIGWAKKGIFSFSKIPLNILTASGLALTGVTVLIAFFQIVSHIFFPQSTPKGITTVMLLIMFFGSFSIASTSLLGEYIAKIFEEVKARPIYIRKHLIKNGMIESYDEVIK